VVGELAARFGGEVPGLQVIRPSLEDVYLSLIDGADHGDQAPATPGSTR
jgi:ABC-2 type transport system ATP-binding protein